MNALNKDFYVQFIASFVRKALFAIATLLEAYGVFTTDQVEGVTATAVVMFVTGLVVQGIVLFWQWAKTNHNVQMVVGALGKDVPSVVQKSLSGQTPIAELEKQEQKVVASAIAEIKAEVAASPTTTVSF